jgi:hypothetical protein
VTEAVTSGVTAPRPRADRRLRLLLGVYATLYFSANVVSVLAPRLVKHSPELLIAGSARIRHLLFVVPAGISPWAYALIGGARLFVAAIVCFLLGRWYGSRGFAWLDRSLGGQRPASLRWLEAATDRVGWLFVLLMPGSNVVCVLVGHRKMRPRFFVSLIVAGIAIRLWTVWLAARHWEKQLKDVLDWIGRYQWWLIGGFLAITLAQSVRRARAIQKATAPAEPGADGLGDDGPASP